MTELNEARPCAICLAQKGSRDVVTGIFRKAGLLEHVAINHPNYDAESVWAMPLPGGPREAKETTR